MDRRFYYPSQQPTDTEMLAAERNKLIAIGYLAQGMLGVSTVADGLACTPTAPASLAVQVGPGSIYAQEPVDTAQYGSVPLDSAHQVVKQGIVQGTTSLTLVPPGSAGQAINYLIQAAFSEVDTGSTVLPYFNSANPLLPFSGPNNSGTAQPTIRQGTISLQAKAGTAATAGSQTTPAPDAGYVGLYAVTVANGATALTSAQIKQLVSAPLIGIKLPNIPVWVQGGSYKYAVDSGTANAMIVTLTPGPTAPPADILVRKVNVANTAAMTVQIVGVGTYALINADASPITSGEMTGNYFAHLGFDGTSYRFVNGTSSTSVGSLSASSGEGVNVDGGGVVSLNFPGLTNNPTINPTDLVAFFSQAASQHETMTYAQLLAALGIGLLPGLLNMQVFNTSGLCTPTDGARTWLVFCTAGGGAGASSLSSNCSGGGAGGTAVTMVPVGSISSVTVTIGAGGAATANTAGTNGGNSSFGAFAAASGGTGGKIGVDVADSAGHAGIGTAGLLRLAGCPGNNSSINIPGNGGASFWGGAGLGINNRGGTPFLNALPGTNGGGGGGADDALGGDGGDGLIVVFEFS